MLEKEPTDPLQHDMAEVARTLGNTHRLVLLEHITQGERSVDRLAELAELSVANASQHLQQLKRAGLVETRREGKRVLYRLGRGPVLNLLVAFREYAEHKHQEIRGLVSDSLNNPNQLQGLSSDELVTRMREEGVILLDVRPKEEFNLGHLPGALNIPVEDLDARVSEIPHNQTIVAYCRGPYCVLSVHAVTELRSRGIEACRLKNGFMDWKAAGRDVEISP